LQAKSVGSAGGENAASIGFALSGPISVPFLAQYRLTDIDHAAINQSEFLLQQMTRKRR
jgi:hypothetical protein